jgi:hypothetical protein
MTLGDILPPAAIRVVTAKIWEIKINKPISVKAELAKVLEPYRQHLIMKEVDLDYLCYYLEYMISNKII